MKMNIRSIFKGLPKRTAFNTATFLIGGLICTATLALANADNSTQSVVSNNIIMPYDGYLMVDAAPLTGVRTIKFDLWNAATGGASVWSETQTVNLYNGRFSVGLGSSTSLTATILDAEKVWLSMTVIDSDSQGNPVEIELSGRQSIEPAPFAAWSMNSADFNVAGNLDVVGDVELDGKLTILNKTTLSTNASDQLYISSGQAHSGGVFVGNDFNVNYKTTLGDTAGTYTTTIRGPQNTGSTGGLRIMRSSGSTHSMYFDNTSIDSTTNLTLQGNSLQQTIIGGDLNVTGNYVGDLKLDGRFLPKYQTYSTSHTGDGGATIVNDNGSHKTLMILGNTSAGGDREVKMWDNVTVNKNLSVTGSISTNGSTTLGNGTGDSTTVAGDLTVNGNLKSWPEGNYCIFMSTNSGCNVQTLTNCSCPSGFTFSRLDIDIDGSVSRHASPGAAYSNYSSPADVVGFGMCCK
jgi:hypothetical protein